MPANSAILHSAGNWRLIKLFNRSCTDLGAASVRVLLAFSVLIYLLITNRNNNYLLGEEKSIVYMAVIYFSYASLQWLSSLIFPGPIFTRRAISILADTGVVTYALIIAGETATPFYGGYLWVTIANSLRYGRNYLFVTNIFCVIGFSSVLFLSQYWRNQSVLGFGLLIWLILLPGYVAILLKRLEVALRKANLANKTKSDFVANMSHELRTPLNAILGYSEMLQEDAVTDGNTTAAQDLGKIQHSAKHLLGLINGILDLSKIESGKISLSKECFDIRILFDELTVSMQPLFEKRGNRFEVKYHLAQFQVNTDKLKLKQVMLNLISNANKFTESGKIVVLLENAGLENNRMLIIRIMDTGIGIPQDNLVSIFDPFVQADTSTTRRYEGTGLGLAITLRFVEMLGGTITVNSEENKGSEFTVSIPQQQTLCPVYSQDICELNVQHSATVQ
jgi:two-component system sensor histidine kinase RpfC